MFSLTGLFAVLALLPPDSAHSVQLPLRLVLVAMNVRSAHPPSDARPLRGRRRERLTTSSSVVYTDTLIYTFADTIMNPNEVMPNCDVNNECSYESPSTDQFRRVLVEKFTNNSVSDSDLVCLSEHPHAQKYMELPADKLWVVPMSAMSLETFFVMRFMCLSLNVLVNMVTFGSINDIRQVYSSLPKRMSKHALICRNMIPFANEFAGKHPSAFLMLHVDREMDTIVYTYEFMKRRINAYLHMITSASSNASMEDDYERGSNAYELAVEFWGMHVKRRQVAAKRWQPHGS
ncbi:MAG: hypothetical protein Q9164_004979 [Protoblastenia rupestris]